MESPVARVAAVVVLFESRDALPALVASLRAQTRPCDEWVFCLNGPDDGAGAELRALPESPRLLERPDNPGFAGGVNAALAATDAEFVLLLNPDVVLAPDYVERCLAALGADERRAVAGGVLWRPDGAGRPVVDGAGFSVQPWLRVVDRGAGRPLEGFPLESGEVPGLCGAALLARRSALRAVAEDGQVLDETFWMYKEDQDLAWRLRAAGFVQWLEVSARARHERGWRPGTRGVVAPRLRRHSLKNRYLLLAKHFRWGRDFWRIPFILAFELVQGVVLLLSEPRTMSGYLLAWRALPDALRRRRRARTTGIARTGDG
ncbi:MAG: glycosyltransferase family 2 protein [Planctomycetota bacterium]